MNQKLADCLKVLAFGIVIALLLATQTGFTRSETVYVTEMYTVQQDELLQTIAERYIVKNTGSVRRVDEFADGIRERNYSIIGDGDVKAGEVLTIGYWEVEVNE